MYKIGAAATAVLVLFLVYCVHATRRYRIQVAIGNSRFIQSHKFMFSRFSVHWYGALLLARNFLVAMTPIISDEAVNVLLLSVVLLVGVAVQIRYFPWRAGFFANVIDAVTSLCFITVVIGAGLLLDIPSGEAAERAALILMTSILVLAVCGWICGVMDNLL